MNSQKAINVTGDQKGHKELRREQKCTKPQESGDRTKGHKGYKGNRGYKGHTVHDNTRKCRVQQQVLDRKIETVTGQLEPWGRHSPNKWKTIGPDITAFPLVKSIAEGEAS